MSSAEQGAAATEPLSSVHTVTERDLAACMACRPSLDPAAARRRARARYGWALGIAIMTPLVAVGVRLAPAIVAGIVLASVWIAFYPRAARIADTRAAQRAIAAGAGAEMLGECRLTADDGGIGIEAAGSRRLAWGDVEGVAAIGSTVCVYAGETVVPIPSEAFGGSSTEMRRFIDVARERSGAGAGDHDTESAGPDAARG